MIPVPRVLSEFFEVDGYSVATITNPLPADYAGIGVKGDTLPGSGGIGVGLSLSVTPDGSVEVRPAGTAGAWERCKRQGGWAIYAPASGVVMKIPCA